jgi:oligopeptide transport system ATP-binding protein
MFSIGEFARHGRVSVRMLRHYDAIGLIRPACVDSATGYRFYQASQLDELNRVIALKDLGFTLQQVQAILDGKVSAAELRGMLKLRRAEIQATIDAETTRLARVEGRPPLGLLAPRQRRPELTEAPLLQVKDLVHEFRTDLGTVHAVSGVSFDVRAGETLGIVGETGSGKSTLARSIVQAPRPTSGAVVFRGADLVTLRGASLLRARRHLQMVFQDPFGSLDPKWRVRDLVEEPLIAYKTGDRTARRRRVDEVLELVGLAGHSTRRPRELSGGQAQRVAIARAVALNPALIICDEAVSSLDVLIQAQVLNLFERLRAELGLSYLFIAHDLALVKRVSDRVAVMYLGKLCEVGPGEEVYRQPLHPYTRALLDSVPDTATARKTRTIRGAIQGEPPSPVHPPSGCRFRTRCPRAEQRCADEEPAVRELPTGHTAGHSVACHFPLVPADTSVRSEEKIGETPR